MYTKKRNIVLKILFILLIFSCCFLVSSYYVQIKQLNDIQSFTETDLEIIEDRFKGSIIKPKVVENVASSGQTEAEIEFKFFNLFKIKTINKPLKRQKSVYVNGKVYDFELKLDGVMIKEFETVKTSLGEVNPLKNSKLDIGDCILKINGEKIASAEDLISKVEKSNGAVKLTILKGAKEQEINVTPAIDNYGNRKLGVWIKDDSKGTGTMSFIDEESNHFIALGHDILDYETGSKIYVDGGMVKECNIVGVKKSRRGLVGELKTVNISNATPIAEISSNFKWGLYGKYLDKDLINSDNKMLISGSLEVNIGKAQIYCDVQGAGARYYSIDIVKVSPQQSEKSLVLKITDKDLLDLTGGIVQGMSGSPIIQNGKLAGILTHCFVNDPTRGFGVLANTIA